MFQFYKAESRKFFEFVRTVSNRVDGGGCGANTKQVKQIVCRPKRTVREITAAVTLNLMNLYTANKKLGFNVSLSELKNMTPQESYLLLDKITFEAAQLNMRNRRGN